MKNACPRWSFLAVPVLAALGCSDPVPLPAQAAITLSIAKPVGTAAVPGKDCGVTQTYQVGDPTPPNTITHGDSVIDGDKGASVACSVRGKGPFTFSGSVHAAALDSNKNPITVTFTDGQVGADMLNGTATVSVFTPQLAGTFNSEPGACKISVLHGQIKPGSIWATFSCPGISAPPALLCAISESVIVFENCDGS